MPQLLDKRGLISGATLSRREREALFRQLLDAVKREHAANLADDFDQNPFRNLKRRFVIAHTPRVGSHLLCEGLLAHGASVEEIFEESRVKNIALRRGYHSLQEYCEWVLLKHAIAGVFGVSGEIKILAPLEMAGELPEFVSDWRFVYLKRLDFVEQAVSEMVAQTTRAFKSSTMPTKALTEEDYDGKTIARLIDRSMAINASWEGAFSCYGVAPLRLTYEELTADPSGVIANTAAFLDLGGPPIRHEWLRSPPLQKQATTLNLTWATRFREENQAFCRAREAGFFEI